MEQGRRIKTSAKGEGSGADIRYDKYSFCLWEWGGCLGAGIGVAFVVAWIFYQSFYGCVLGVIIFPLLCKIYRKYRIEQRKQKLILQFKENMRFVAGALQAGYSIERAWVQAEKELTTLFGAEADMVIEIRNMNRKIRLHEPVEHALQDFAERCQLEDVENFSQIMNFAKRGGGDFLKIIWTTVNQISEKSEIREEINTSLAEKKLEQKIMNVVPMLLLGYLNLASPGFLTPLYHNMFGVVIMTGALLVYALTIFAAEKIMDVEV